MRYMNVIDMIHMYINAIYHDFHKLRFSHADKILPPQKKTSRQLHQKCPAVVRSFSSLKAMGLEASLMSGKARGWRVGCR